MVMSILVMITIVEVFEIVGDVAVSVVVVMVTFCNVPIT